MKNIQLDQDDGGLLDIFLTSREILESLMTSRMAVSTLFFWFQVPSMLLSWDIAMLFDVSSLTGAVTSN